MQQAHIEEQAWSLVQAYIERTSANTQIDTGPYFNKDRYSPLGALLRYELDRRGLSFERAQTLLVQALYQYDPSAQPRSTNGMFHLVKRPTQQATRETLFQIHYTENTKTVQQRI